MTIRRSNPVLDEDEMVALTSNRLEQNQQQTKREMKKLLTLSTRCDDSTNSSCQSIVGIENCTVRDEIQIMLRLAIPVIVLQLSAVFPTFFVTSYIGRVFGSFYLQSYTLATSVCNVGVLVIIEGIYRALETLLPQSYGAGNYSELQAVTIRGMTCCLVLLIPIAVILAIYMNPLLLYIGEDPDASAAATQWYRIFAFDIPLTATYQVVSSFLSAQHVLVPESIISIVCSTVVLVLALNVFCPMFGFLGSSIAMVFTTAVQVTVLLLYCYIQQPYNPQTWPPIPIQSLWEFWNDTILDWTKLSYFTSLGFGGILASAYWIYWELLTLMIGTLDDDKALAIFTIQSQVSNVVFMIPLGIGVAMTIRIGNLLPLSPSRAKLLCWYGSLVSIVVYAIMSILLYIFRFHIYALFTSEPELINGCEQMWSKVVLYCFNMCIYAMNMGIATSLGKQGTVGCICIVVLHGITLPAVYFLVISNRNGSRGSLAHVWDIICPSYIPINIALFTMFFVWTDWDKIANTVRLREGLIPFVFSETASLSSSSSNSLDDDDDDDNDNNNNKSKSGIECCCYDEESNKDVTRLIVAGRNNNTSSNYGSI